MTRPTRRSRIAGVALLTATLVGALACTLDVTLPTLAPPESWDPSSWKKASGSRERFSKNS